MAKRIGAKTVKGVDPQLLKKLNDGTLPSANLVEALAIDLSVLAKSVGIKAPPYEEKSIVKKMKYYGGHIQDWRAFKQHPSDTVRGLAAYALAAANLPLEKKIEEMLHFADDEHFGVREWAWLALREEMAANLDTSLGQLAKLVRHKSANVRRFSCEALRPRGVWCAHITELKSHPDKGLPILEALKQDTEVYVKDSVGNWLNDASKSQADWVRKLCQKWKKLKDPNTDYIIKKALRSLR